MIIIILIILLLLIVLLLLLLILLLVVVVVVVIVVVIVVLSLFVISIIIISISTDPWRGTPQIFGRGARVDFAGLTPRVHESAPSEVLARCIHLTISIVNISIESTTGICKLLLLPVASTDLQPSGQWHVLPQRKGAATGRAPTPPLCHPAPSLCPPAPPLCSPTPYTLYTTILVS